MQEQLVQLQRHNTSDGESDDEDSDNEDDVENPFHNHSPAMHRSHRNFERDLNIKVDILEFEGRAQPDDFIDWLHTVERIFEYKGVPDNCKVKIVAIKLKKHASTWWEHLKKLRAREGKGKIVTWEKLHKALKKKFLPDNLRQDAF